MICRKCGRVIYEGSRFCNYCGERVDSYDGEDYTGSYTYSENVGNTGQLKYKNNFGKIDALEDKSRDEIKRQNEAVSYQHKSSNLKIGMIVIGVIVFIIFISSCINDLANQKPKERVTTQYNTYEDYISTSSSYQSDNVENIGEPSGDHSIEYDYSGGTLYLESGEFFSDETDTFELTIKRVSVEVKYGYTYVYVYCDVTNTSRDTCRYNPVMSVSLENDGVIDECLYSENMGNSLVSGKTISDKLTFTFDEYADTDIDNMTLSTDSSTVSLYYDGV